MTKIRVWRSAPAAKGMLGALLLCSLACGCDRPERSGLSTVHAKESSGRPVRLARSRLIDLRERVSATGTLRPQDSVVVKAELSGRLSQITVDLGSTVKRGALLALIDPEDYRLRVAQAEAALSQARALLGLPERGEAVLDVAQASVVRQAQATLEEERGT